MTNIFININDYYIVEDCKKTMCLISISGCLNTGELLDMVTERGDLIRFVIEDSEKIPPMIHDSRDKM